MNDDLWASLGGWWTEELISDPAYSEEVEPLLLDLLSPQPGDTYLDIGCGEGRMLEVLRSLGSQAVGCDFNPSLLKAARTKGPVVRTRLPSLGWAAVSAFDGALVSLVLEHLSDDRGLFTELAAAVRPGGTLVLVINHPIWTAPDSSPIEDPSGETLWRPGVYFGRGHSDEPAGRQIVRFYHRTMADLLNGASDSGWDLQCLEERGISPAAVERYPEYAGQEHIPRLLGAKWRRRT